VVDRAEPASTLAELVRARLGIMRGKSQR
jgi:hypothetical protein